MARSTVGQSFESSWLSRIESFIKMPSTIQLQEKRDRKEGDLGAYENAVTAQEQGFKFNKKMFEKKLAEYQEWKIENKIEGIKY